MRSGLLLLVIGRRGLVDGRGGWTGGASQFLILDVGFRLIHALLVKGEREGLLVVCKWKSDRSSRKVFKFDNRSDLWEFVVVVV